MRLLCFRRAGNVSKGEEITLLLWGSNCWRYWKNSSCYFVKFPKYLGTFVTNNFIFITTKKSIIPFTMLQYFELVHKFVTKLGSFSLVFFSCGCVSWPKAYLQKPSMTSSSLACLASKKRARNVTTLFSQSVKREREESATCDASIQSSLASFLRKSVENAFIRESWP